MKRKICWALLAVAPMSVFALCDAANNSLIHRWSFNGGVEDSVGDSDATIVGNVTTDGKQYKLPGGTSGSAYIDLGDNLVPTTCKAVTLEFWATRETGSGHWDRVYDFGSMPAGYSFSSGYTSCYSTDNIRLFWNGETDFNLGVQPTIGTQYHIAAVFEETTGGKWQVHYYVQPSAGGTVTKTTREMDTGWSFSKVGQTEWLLGQALTCWDSCAKASYDEVRIWEYALSEEEFSENTSAGADAIIPEESDVPPVKPDGDYVETVNGVEWSYSVADGVATIVGKWLGFPSIPVDTAGEVVVPTELGGCPVMHIGSFAFSGCSEIVKIVIPSSVLDVGYIGVCTNLRDVHFNGDAPYGVDYLDNSQVTLHIQDGADGWDDYYDSRSYVSGQGWVNEWHVIRHFNSADDGIGLVMGGDAGWCSFGGTGFRSGSLTDGQTSEMSKTVEGGGTFSFEWKVSGEEHYDFLSVFVDGSLFDRISGSESKWLKVSIPLASDRKRHVVTWVYRKDCEGSAGDDCGYVRNISFGEGVPSFDYLEDNDYDVGAHYRSKRIEDGESVEQSVVVTGSRGLSTLWKVSSEEGHDFLQVYVDGELFSQISGETDWQWCSVEFPDTKTHLVTWKYVKDDAGSAGEDCGFLGANFDTSTRDDYEYLYGQLAWTTGNQPPSFGASSWLYHGKIVEPGANEWDIGTAYTAYRSGELGASGQVSLLPMTVSGSGTLSFKWKRNDNSGTLKLLVDGEVVKTCPYIYSYGENEAWDSVTYKILKSGTHQLAWQYSDCYGNNPSEYGIVCGISWSGEQKPWVAFSGSEGDDDQDLSGDAAWIKVDGEEGVYQSGAISDDQESLLPITFEGEGCLTFDWKVSSNWDDYLYCEIDGDEYDYRCSRISGDEDWTSVSIYFYNDATHTVKWKYRKNSWDSSGDDCGWVRNVQWSPYYGASSEIKWLTFQDETEEPEDEVIEYTWQTSVNDDGTLTITGVSPTPSGVVVLPTMIGGVKVTAIEKLESDYTQWGVLSQGWDSPITDLVVPEGYVKIGRRAFSSCANLKSVSFPSSLVEIGHYAFQECSSLSSISLPTSLRRIGETAFYGTDLAYLKIPEGVMEIGTEAFAFNRYNATGKRLCEVLLPSTLVSLGDSLEYRDTAYAYNPFAGCADGCRFAFPKGNATYSVLNGQIVSKDGAIVSGAVCDGVVEIPEQAKIISAFAYALQPSLKRIVIPATVKTLCCDAFYNCGLEEVTMQDGGVEVINSSAFEYCSSLKKLTLPQGLKKVNGYFCAYTPVARLEIPASFAETYNMFYAMTNLDEVVFAGDAPKDGSGVYVPFSEVPKSAHFKVRLGSRGWDGDPYSAEMPSSGMWPGSYGDYGRPISTYGDRPDEWDNGWWKTLDYSTSDDGWTHANGVWQSAPWKAETYSSDVHTNYVEFIFNGAGVFTCELKLKASQGYDYAYVVIDGTDMKAITSSGSNSKWQHVEYAVGEGGMHTIRVEYRIRNNYYGAGAIAYLQNVTWTPKSSWVQPEYVWTTADNGDGTVTITDVSPKPQYDVEVPAEIKGKKVTIVGDGTEGFNNEKLFYENTLITSVSIPEGVVSVGNHCFSGCYSLKNVTLPSTLKELGAAFPSCYSLAEIDIPAGVTQVQSSTFFSCRSLSRVTFRGDCPKFGGSINDAFPQGCVITVTHGTTGWGDIAIPGFWYGYPIEYVKLTIAQALNNEVLNFDNDEDYPWDSTFDASHDNIASVRSGVIGNGQTTQIRATVEGTGTLSFWWKVDSETFVYRGKTYLADMAAFTCDGERLEFGGTEDWTFVTMKLPAGKHDLMWSFEKDAEDDVDWSGEDCVWLDEVTWSPDVVAPTLGELANVFGEDSDVVKNITNEAELVAYNGFLKACSISSAADLSAAQKQYAYQSFKLSEITTAPQLFEDEPVLKIDDLEMSGGNLSLTISLTAGAEAIQLAKDKLAEKIRVGTSLDSIVGAPSILDSPSADGTSLTFTISPPQGGQGFVKVIVE